MLTLSRLVRAEESEGWISRFPRIGFEEEGDSATYYTREASVAIVPISKR
jgi:hypothetical protein